MQVEEKKKKFMRRVTIAYDLGKYTTISISSAPHVSYYKVKGIEKSKSSVQKLFPTRKC